MAKTGVKTNIPKAIREFEKSIDDLMKETESLEASLAVQAMNEVRRSGLIRGEHADKNKRRYEDIKQSDSGIIIQRAKSQKGKTKNRNSYKYKGQTRQRKRKYMPRNRGDVRIRKVFHKRKMAVRSGDFYEIFSHKTQFSMSAGKLTQSRKNALIKVGSFNQKDKLKTIEFSFFGAEGKSLRMLSYGRKRTQPLKIENGKELKGRKGKRDIVANALRKTFNRHNKLIQKYIDSDYKKRFDRIK